jgi:hypothetical protein
MSHCALAPLVAWRYSDCWSIGFQLMHESGNNLQNLLHDGRRGIAVRRAQPRSPCCRLTPVCLQVCSGIMVFSTGLIAFFAFISIAPSHSASSLAASAVAAAVACTQCAFDPSLIAHGGLMTSDTVLSLFWLISPVLLWHAIITATVPSPLQTASRPPLFRRLLSFMSTLLYLVTTGAATGLLIAAKHSGVLVAPVIIMFLAVLVMMLRDNACPAMHMHFFFNRDSGSFSRALARHPCRVPLDAACRCCACGRYRRRFGCLLGMVRSMHAEAGIVVVGLCQ